LLFLGVARNLDDIHAVAQRARYGEAIVAGADKEDIGEIVWRLEVMIGERVVLLRIEHLEQRRRRVTAVVGRHLIDLVQQEDRVSYAGRLHRLDDAPRERADVRALVAANLSLVMHAAER